ncbi:MAG: DEAD/DEAH box helicase family protein [Pyrinomonadaceae bacterium]|nr:DEAD/DEAH box helicase family protein [Pyrinomonadaceae bacterium]
MPKSVISYQKDLPEIPGRCAWEKPTSFLVKDASSESGWRVDESGRRKSSLLLVNKLRAEVDTWRDKDYEGASEVTKDLFRYWFEEDHEVAGFPVPFRYHFCQREAMETLAYVVEVLENRDAKDLIDIYAEAFQADLLTKSIEYQTTMDGRRQIRRYVPELNSAGVQDLPLENLRRYAFRMATGSGKTWVIAMAIVWSYFHRKQVPGSNLSTNFLIVAPNVIVYQRLEKDFASNRLFSEIPLVPPEWRPWNPKVILRDDSIEPDASGNIFLTNIHQLYESREQDWVAANPVDAMLGRVPSKDLSSHQRSMLERVKTLTDLVVINDEAHHVHDEDLAWSQSLLGIHKSLPKGLSLWLDFSATPRDQNRIHYSWTICDYPLAQAVEDRIVKAPIIVTKEDDPNQPAEPEEVTKDNVTEKYGYWIHAAVQCWHTHYKIYKKLNRKPVLFIMAEKNSFADAIGKYLGDTPEFRIRPSEVKIIHTDNTGEITKKGLEEARALVRDIDQPSNKIKAIVSVMMLREGWDVRSVTVVLGLRPFTARAEILPEQVIGRGLRLMMDVGPDTQTLEVLGTRKLLDFLRQQLEIEGVGVGTEKGDPAQPVTITAVEERLEHDIEIPMTKPRLTHDFRKLETLDPSDWKAIYSTEDLEEPFRVSLIMEFATTQTEVHQADLVSGEAPLTQSLLSSITNKVIYRAKLTNVFKDLFPVVRDYVGHQCFGKSVDLDSDNIRNHLRRFEIQEAIARYLARKVAELIVERREIEFEPKSLKLSSTRPFFWRRNLPPLTCKRTVFNYVATYNNFERQFAEFLDKAPDVLRFAALGTTQQGDSASVFRVDYLKLTGAIGFYHPDWVVVQSTPDGTVNWIIETKGREWPGTKAKYESINSWCERITEQTDSTWKFAVVNQTDFDWRKPTTLVEAVNARDEQALL